MVARKHRFAAIQLHPKPMQMAANYARAEALVRQAASAGAELAVLPEYCLTNWVPSHPAWGDVAEDRTYLHKFCELAKELSINIVPGTFVEKHVGSDGRKVLYNNAYFISNSGEVLGKYTKKNLWHPEREHLESSGHDPHAVIDTPVGKVGLLICWDLAFPEPFRALLHLGAEIIIIPTFWTLFDLPRPAYERNPLSEQVFLNSTLVSRAFENEVCIVFSNAGGPPDKGYAGLTQIDMPFYGCMAIAEGTGEQVVIADVEMDVLDEAENAYKIKGDLKREGWWYPVPGRKELEGVEEGEGRAGIGCRRVDKAKI